MNRRAILTGCATLTATAAFGGLARAAAPYSLRFSLPDAALAQGFDAQPWNDPGQQAVVPRAAWYDDETRQRWGPWGPPARQYPAPVSLNPDPDWIGQRIVWAAGRHIGLDYQHHHVPAWSPPDDWPWTPVKSGRTGPGLDCSNFTSFVTNTALGIKLPTGIGRQAGTVTVAGPGGRGSVTLRRLDPRGYAEAVAILRPGDLLFIRSDAGRVSHVVFWLGACGIAADDTPLILDCHGGGLRGPDAPIPAGVQIRPFRPDGWYGRSFAHAHRIVDFGTGSGPAPAYEEGGG